mgnify:CR=1 FL=1
MGHSIAKSIARNEDLRIVKIKKNIPKILISFKNWSNINHAKIAAKTPSNEKTIAAGAGDIFCKLYVCNKKARPLDRIPTYKTSYESFKKLLNVGSSK